MSADELANALANTPQARGLARLFTGLESILMGHGEPSPAMAKAKGKGSTRKKLTTPEVIASGGGLAPVLEMEPKTDIAPITDGQRPSVEKKGQGLPSANPRKPSKKKKRANLVMVEYNDLKDDPYINKPILQLPEKPSR